MDMFNTFLAGGGGFPSADREGNMADNGNTLAFGFVNNCEVCISRQPVHDFDEIRACLLLVVYNLAGFLGSFHHNLIRHSRRIAVNDGTREIDSRSVDLLGRQVRPKLVCIKRTSHLANTRYSVYEIHGICGLVFRSVNMHVPQSGDQEFAAPIYDPSARRHGDVFAFSDTGDLALRNHHSLVCSLVARLGINHDYVSDVDLRVWWRRRVVLPRGCETQRDKK